jgi:FkbM family methyltransferase
MMKFINLLNQSKEKFRQIASFYRNSNTPIVLTLDSLKLKKRPFIAQSKEGLKLSLKPSVGESFTFYENLIRRDYLRHGIQLNQGDTVIDIGANIGAFTVLAASIVGSQGQVLAFEPEATTFKCLLKNIQLNDLKNVIAINQAIDNKVAGSAELRVGDKSAFSNIHGSIEHMKSISTQTVKTTTLTQVFENYKLTSVKLMKVDCEGSEYRIFDTLPQSIASCIE